MDANIPKGLTHPSMRLQVVSRLAYLLSLRVRDGLPRERFLTTLEERRIKVKRSIEDTTAIKSIKITMTEPFANRCVDIAVNSWLYQVEIFLFSDLLQKLTNCIK